MGYSKLVNMSEIWCWGNLHGWAPLLSCGVQEKAGLVLGRAGSCRPGSHIVAVRPVRCDHVHMESGSQSANAPSLQVRRVVWTQEDEGQTGFSSTKCFWEQIIQGFLLHLFFIWYKGLKFQAVWAVTNYNR